MPHKRPGKLNTATPASAIRIEALERSKRLEQGDAPYVGPSLEILWTEAPELSQPSAGHAPRTAEEVSVLRRAAIERGVRFLDHDGLALAITSHIVERGVHFPGTRIHTTATKLTSGAITDG